MENKIDMRENEELMKSFEEKAKAGYWGVDENGQYEEPVFNTVSIQSEDICPQMVNPNTMHNKAFDALLTSIWNNGYCFPVLVAENPLYDPSTEELEKPLCFSGEQDVVDVRDPEIRKFYKYMSVDGSHRVMATVFGSTMYDSVDMPPSHRELTKKIYKRNSGKIPCVVIQGKTDNELMSAEILFNAARGEHSITEMRDIVIDMLRGGMSQQWISKHLFLEPAAINRFAQLGGISAAFNTESGLVEAWDPVQDGINERRKKINITNAARRYVRKYRELRGMDTTFGDESVDIIEAALHLGFDENDPNMIPKTLDLNGRVFEKEYNSNEAEISEDKEEENV